MNGLEGGAPLSHHHDLDITFDDSRRPLDCLTAYGDLREALREREAHLMRQAKAEGATWLDVTDALQLREEVAEVLYGSREERARS